MLKKLRIILAAIFFIGITLLFVDFTGALKGYLGWMAKLQFLPALLAGNVVVVGLLLILTLFFGRIYCSVICPLGVMQDIFFAGGIKAKKNRCSYSPAKKILKYTVLVLFVVALVLGANALVAVIAPYSAYGRIAQSLLAPVYAWVNNIFAYFAERSESYAFYSTEVWIKGVSTLVVAIVTLLVLAVLAWRNGRTWCNTICPVGTVLGWFAKFSFFKPVIDTTKCVNCTKCGKNCKASCINTNNHTIDYSRCVACMDCLENCSVKAISYKWVGPKGGSVKPVSVDEVNAQRKACEVQSGNVDSSKREFIASAAAVAGGLAATMATPKLFAQDGALADVMPKEAPARNSRLVPAGSLSVKNFHSRCTSCQLCVSKCPNGVLRPSSELKSFMQPYMSYEKGYCRPECTNCADVCPAGAIKPITVEEKTSIKIGTAVVVAERCLEAGGKDHCGKCSRSCPAGAITMMHTVNGDETSPKIPVVDENKCIGCGKCENLCPVRPLSAIYVEGLDIHRTI
ncbi:MAG: 4Fe-4S binding protein [Bacteroidales bacterium]|nr:4Fe-4S binding protein [Candidatus Egerieousia equi]